MAARTITRTPMSVKMRAKQFVMFDAMKGLTEAIAEKEKQFCYPKELSEERIEEINRILTCIQEGTVVTVQYYCQYGRNNCEISGIVENIDFYWKEIQVDRKRILFSELEDVIVRKAH